MSRIFRSRRHRRYADEDDAEPAAAASCCMCCCLGIVLIFFLGLTGESRRRFVHGHWLPYILPTGGPAWVWEILHGQNGGMWKYGTDVQSAVTAYILQSHHNYSSLLDVACNQGFMLARLQRARPHARYYGTDISKRMLLSTQARCSKCITAQLDLNQIASASLPSVSRAAGGRSDAKGSSGSSAGSPLPATFPTDFDLVVVSDVLYFIAWDGFPPVLCNVLPPTLLRAAHRRFFDALHILASREIIFSDHQGNKCVMDFLRSVGASRRQVAVPSQNVVSVLRANHDVTQTGVRTGFVWVTPGGASPSRVAVSNVRVDAFGPAHAHDGFLGEHALERSLS